jgi:hypothetical protein
VPQAVAQILCHLPHQVITPITRAEAAAAGMKPLTIPAYIEEPFLQRVIRDMERVPGTEWALVQYKQGGAVEVWRVPLPPQDTDKLSRTSSF